jgi:25S rRNA (uracil2634-N3)-methyltransferase
MSRKLEVGVDDSAENHDSYENQTKSSLPPLRDTSQLFASPKTISCARQCVPCAYKIGSFDVALDKDFCKQVPNQRPEQCPRASSHLSAEDTMGFRVGMSVLTVGDGDFSFSLALARLLKPSSTKSTLVATSYEDKETLRRVYPDFDSTLDELESLGATLCYKVDATRIPFSEVKKFHRICWNFPCTAISKGQDGQNDEMERNKELVRRFVENASRLLSPVDGEIHICHKTKPPFNHWKLENIALQNMKDGGLHYAGRVVLDRYLLPPYTPRKALDRKSFPCHDACFYIFAHNRQIQACDSKKFPSTLSEDSTDGSASAIPITPDVILSFRRSLLLSRASQRSKQNTNTESKKRRLR